MNGFTGYRLLVTAFFLFLSASTGWAQSSGAIEGTVIDPSGGAVANATVEMTYAVSGFRRTTTTRSDGGFRFPNVPFNPYHLLVQAAGFAPFAKDVDVRSGVPVVIQISLQISALAVDVMVEAHGRDLVENDPTFHTDVDRGRVDK